MTLFLLIFPTFGLQINFYNFVTSKLMTFLVVVLSIPTLHPENAENVTRT